LPGTEVFSAAAKKYPRISKEEAMTVEPCVRSYKQKTDCGFAPNPYGGTLTIATCKPGIREVAVPGEWIAGFTSKALNKDPVGEERLVFLMRVTEKLRREEYYARFPQKRPDQCPCGDNIYRPDGNGAYSHCGGCHHKEEKNQQNDHKSAWVLLSDEFYYFGGVPLFIDRDFRPKLPSGQTRYGSITRGDEAVRFITFVKKRAAELYPGQSGQFEEPHSPCGAKCPGGCARKGKCK
jgi:hypothetical protein